MDVTDGRLRLFPVASHDIAGDHDPATWKYRVNLAGPDYQTSIENVSSDNIVHVMYAREPERPWRGTGPIQAAILAGRLSASTAAALADEASGPRGSFLPMPKDAADCDDRRFEGGHQERKWRDAHRREHGRELEIRGSSTGGLEAAALWSLPPRFPDQAAPGLLHRK